WRKEAVPYLRYMGQSGLPGFAALAAITGLIGYTGFLRDVPADFPIAAAGTAVLTPLLAWSPLRTYLAAADTVFLMPREHRMGEYMRGAQLRGYVLAAVLFTAVWLLYMPLYAKGGYPT